MEQHIHHIFSGIGHKWVKKYFSSLVGFSFNRGNGYRTASPVWSCPTLFRRSWSSARSCYRWRSSALWTRRRPATPARRKPWAAGPPRPWGRWGAPSCTCPRDGRWSCWSVGWRIPSTGRNRTRTGCSRVSEPDGAGSGIAGKLCPGLSENIKWEISKDLQRQKLDKWSKR